MAKTVIRANATLDTLTEPELNRSLAHFMTEWRAELLRGVKFRRILRKGVADASGNLMLGGSDSRLRGLGPEEGFIWSVDFFSLYPLTTGGTAIVRLYQNTANDGDLVRGDYTPVNSAVSDNFGGRGLIMQGGSTLLLTASGLTAGTSVTLTGQATEVPFNNAYGLL
jgi:hypothetical protein